MLKVAVPGQAWVRLQLGPDSRRSQQTAAALDSRPALELALPGLGQQRPVAVCHWKQQCRPVKARPERI